MEYKVKKNNNATAEITIQFTPEEWEKGFDKAYMKNKDKVKVPGFRPGKAPMDRIKKILGDSVMDDAINYTLNDAIMEIFPSLEPRPFRVPRFSIQDEELNRSKGFTAVATYDTFPEVTLPKIKKVKVETFQVEPTSSDIQKELEVIQNSLARNVLKEESELVADKNLIEINYKFAESGQELPETNLTGKVKLGDKNNLPGFDAHLIGMKIGEAKKFDYTYPTDFPQSPESAGKTFHYEITVTAAYNVALPEINDDMASEFDGSESLDELKKKIATRIKEEKNEELKNRTFTEIYEKLIEDGKFVIPESLIKEETEHVFQNMFAQFQMKDFTIKKYAEAIGKPEEEVEATFRGSAIKRLQGYFLRLKIAEEEKIEVTEVEFQEKLRTYAEKFGEDVEAFLKRVEKEGSIDSVRDNFLMEKVDDYVYETVEKKGPKTIDLEEANKLLNRENKAA